MVPVGNQPNENAVRQSRIAKYLFHTALSLRYTEGLDSKREDDFKEVVTFLTNGTLPQFMQGPVVWETEQIIRLGRNGARSTAMLALLNRQKPFDLINHDKQVALNRQGIEQAEVHHVFPKAYLTTINRGDESDRALNFTLLTRDSNNFISDRMPSLYVSDIISRIKTERVCSEESARAQILEVLESHFMDSACLDALLANDYDAFLLARSECLRKEVEKLGIEVLVAVSDGGLDLEDDEELE
jgi:hypothetical protein